MSGNRIYVLPWIIYWWVMWAVICGCVVAAFFSDGIGAAVGPILGLTMWSLFGAAVYFLFLRPEK